MSYGCGQASRPLRHRRLLQAAGRKHFASHRPSRAAGQTPAFTSSLIIPSRASRYGVSTCVTRASSTTALTIASTSSGRPSSRSCSIDVLCSPTSAAPLRRASTSTAIFSPSASATACASSMTLRAKARVAGSAADLRQGRARQGAERVEGDVAPELDPDLAADAAAQRRAQAGVDQRLRQRRDALGAGAVRLAQAEAVVIDVADHARRFDLAGGIDDAADHALRADRVPDAAAGVDGLDAAVGVTAPVEAVEVPPGHAVLRRDDGGLGPEQRRDGVERGRDRVRLDGEDDVVLRRRRRGCRRRGAGA